MSRSPISGVPGFVGFSLLVAVSTRCRGEYSIAPTACDDWCLAVQRADCSEDRPDDCVSDCEREALGRQHPECEHEWFELIGCYRNADRDRFSCIEGASRPDDDLCTGERVTLGLCLSERQAVCTEECIRTRSECGQSTWRCEPDCQGATPGCDREYVEYHRCLLQAPVVCEGTEESSSEQDEPCVAEGVDLLTCVGWEEP